MHLILGVNGGGGVMEESRGSQIMFKFIHKKMDYLKK